MTILAMNTAGTFSGSYHTAVAVTSKQILVSPLQGVQQHPSAKRHPRSASPCSGKETLETTWLLREEVLSHKDTWKATRVGTSTFTRIK
uniref:Uncharacterized protein n=1 Tax=Ficedula albicollis TaxID=59894 RepID=A0A803W241_FICAL